MDYFIIMLGVVMALVPTFFVLKNEKTKKLNKWGIILVLISILFIGLSFIDSKNENEEVVIREKRIDSLNYEIKNINKIADSISMQNRGLNDSIQNLRIALLEKDNQILKNLNESQKITKQYFKNNTELQEENFEKLQVFEKGKIIEDEPFIIAKKVELHDRNQNGDFRLKAHLYNQGGRTCSDLKVSVKLYDMEYSKVKLLESTSFATRSNYIIEEKRGLGYVFHVSKKEDLKGDLVLHLEYKYKDKIQPNKVLFGEDIYKLRKDPNGITSIGLGEKLSNKLKEMAKQNNR